MSSPSEFKQKQKEFGIAVQAKLAADANAANATAGSDDAAAASSKQQEANTNYNTVRESFLTWSHDNLSMIDEATNNATIYRYVDDGEGEPLKGGEVPDVDKTISQLNRLKSQLKDLTVAPVQKEMQVQPFLSSPFQMASNVVAYRGNLLAAVVTPGCYRLISISDQIFWNRDSLADSDMINAGRVSDRVLHRCREASPTKKRYFIEACKGIVGVAHKGYHTLNRASAVKHGRRIGDCMIEVSWDLSLRKHICSDELLPRLDARKLTGKTFTTFEIRSDWCQFRGKTRGDWEIYRFAKDVDSGDIPPDGGFRVQKEIRLRKAIESAPRWALRPQTRKAIKSKADKLSAPADLAYSDTEDDESYGNQYSDDDDEEDFD